MAFVLIKDGNDKYIPGYEDWGLEDAQFMSNITFFYICIKKLKGLTNKEYKLISTKFVTDNLIPCKRNVTPKYDF